MSSSDNLEVGLVLSPDYYPINQLTSFSKKVDEMGYRQISVPEIWGHDSISFLSIIAEKTDNIELSTGIISMYSRTPALAAMTAASIDEISNGRFILGLGLSGPKVIENWHGIDYQKPLTRTREYISIIRAILKKEKMNIETSQLGTIKDFRISIKNVRADIPIHLASIGPKNIELTAQIADGWLPIMMSLTLFKEEVIKMKERVSSYNRDPNDFAFTPFIPTLVGETEKHYDLLRYHLGYYLGSMGTFYNNILKRSGFVSEAEEIMDYYKRGDVLSGNRAITDEIIDAICVHGPKDEALERLIAIQKAGATRPLLAVPFRTPLEFLEETFTALSPKGITI